MLGSPPTKLPRPPINAHRHMRPRTTSCVVPISEHGGRGLALDLFLHVPTAITNETTKCGSEEYLASEQMLVCKTMAGSNFTHLSASRTVLPYMHILRLSISLTVNTVNRKSNTFICILLWHLPHSLTFTKIRIYATHNLERVVCVAVIVVVVVVVAVANSGCCCCCCFC